LDTDASAFFFLPWLAYSLIAAPAGADSSNIPNTTSAARSERLKMHLFVMRTNPPTMWVKMGRDSWHRAKQPKQPVKAKQRTSEAIPSKDRYLIYLFETGT
jgi:hypothetical protein